MYLAVRHWLTMPRPSWCKTLLHKPSNDLGGFTALPVIFKTQQEMNMKSTGLSLADLNLVDASENAYEFEYLRSDGRPTGVYISVLGSQAPKVQEWIRKTLNRRRTQEALAAKRGKEIERMVEDDEQFGIEAAAIRIVGWRGISEPYSPENALALCSNNSEVRDQVFEASNNLGNFSKSQSKD
jgi:hypothetical protein